MTIHNNFPLRDILYYQIGGVANFLLEVHNADDLFEAIRFLKTKKIEKILPVGLGSNLLVSDDFFDGAVLWFSRGESKGEINDQIELKRDNLIEAFSSVLLDDLIQFSFKSKLVGLEWAGGLPSTVGGAIRGNAGAFGREIREAVEEVDMYDISIYHTGIRTLRKKDLRFSYRDSLIKKDKNLLIVSARFELQRATAEEIEKAKKVYQDHIEYRKKNNPLEYPSCGSVFQNITTKDKVETVVNKWPDIASLVHEKWHGKVAMGYVIKRLGFSGFRIGGAEVSEKHANYILNKNHAKFADVIIIIEKIKEKFYQEFNFYPELEVEVVK